MFYAAIVYGHDLSDSGRRDHVPRILGTSHELEMVIAVVHVFIQQYPSHVGTHVGPAHLHDWEHRSPDRKRTSYQHPADDYGGAYVPIVVGSQLHRVVATPTGLTYYEIVIVETDFMVP